MRKMYSENQIKDIVNKGIEDGSIHADPSTEVKVGDINSESATLGQVIISDGEGGAEWGSAGMEVVTLTSSSGTLTDEEYAKVSGNNCVIKRGDLIYQKTAWSPIKYIAFDISNTNDTAFIITVNSNKSWNNKVLTIKEPVKAYEGTSLLPTNVEFSGWSLHRAINDGNTLWCVLRGAITNNSGSSQTISNIVQITIPESISSKIYRIDGTTCNAPYTSAFQVARTNINITGVNSSFTLASYEANKLMFRITNGFSISSGSTEYLDVCIPLFLDIGTIQ